MTQTDESRALSDPAPEPPIDALDADLDEPSNASQPTGDSALPGSGAAAVGITSDPFDIDPNLLVDEGGADVFALPGLEDVDLTDPFASATSANEEAGDPFASTAAAAASLAGGRNANGDNVTDPLPFPFTALPDTEKGRLADADMERNPDEPRKWHIGTVGVYASLFLQRPVGDREKLTKRSPDHLLPQCLAEVRRRLTELHDAETAEKAIRTHETAAQAAREAVGGRPGTFLEADGSGGGEDEMAAALNAIVAMAGRGGGSRAQRRRRLTEAFVSREGLRSLPPLTAVVDGYLYLDTLAQLNGERGAYKTFLALDWAASVSVGAPWHGRSVQAGDVLYFAGEGVAKFDDRLSAWEAERNGGELSRVEVFRELVDFAADPTVEADWVYVAATLAKREHKPALIVVDTLARYASGHDENSAKDMGQLITNLDVVRRVTGACILIVHHTTRGTDHGRGSTSVEGGMQSVFLMRKPKDGQVDLYTTKQKDGPELEPLAMTVKSVPAASSIVLTSETGTDPFVIGDRPLIGQHSPQYLRVAAALFRTFGEGTSGGTKAEVRVVVQGDEDLKLEGKDAQAVAKAYYSAWATLEKRGALSPAKGNRFHLTEDAAAEFGLISAAQDEDSAPTDEDPDEDAATAAEVAS